MWKKVSISKSVFSYPDRFIWEPFIYWDKSAARMSYFFSVVHFSILHSACQLNQLQDIFYDFFENSRVLVDISLAGFSGDQRHIVERGHEDSPVEAS